MSVSVEINVGGHSSKVAKGSDRLLQQLFEGLGLTGRLVVRVGPLVAGGPQLAGVHGAAIKPVGGNSPRTVVITVQPGDNGTRREFLMDVPNGTDVGEFIKRFKAFVTDHEEVAGVAADSDGETVRTIAQIQAHLRQLREEHQGLPGTFAEQERALAEREADILQRERKLIEDRRQLEADRAGFKQEVGRLNARRRQLEEDIGLTEMELEDAEKDIAEQARGQLEALAASTGMSLDQLLALAQRNGRKA